MTAQEYEDIFNARVEKTNEHIHRIIQSGIVDGMFNTQNIEADLLGMLHAVVSSVYSLSISYAGGKMDLDDMRYYEGVMMSMVRHALREILAGNYSQDELAPKPHLSVVPFKSDKKEG